MGYVVDRRNVFFVMFFGLFLVFFVFFGSDIKGSGVVLKEVGYFFFRSVVMDVKG